MERFIVSARKYRPYNFESLIGQENIVKTLKNSILRRQLAHAYLFCGPRGVGKTTTARIFARTINCLNPSDVTEACGVCESCISFAEGRSYSIHELDAASNNSVEDIRQLNELVRIPPQIGKYSVYIIDEVHMLSQAAFNAFLKTLEEPPAHAVFILATTEKHKILPTILSRCQTYDFNRISVEDMVKNLEEISLKESVSIEKDALHIIAQKADGAMRDALTLFDQTVAFCGGKVTYQQVISTLNVLDYEYYFRLTDLFLQGKHSEALLIFDEILSRGFNALHFIGGLSTHFRDLLISREESTIKLLELSPSLIIRYREQAAGCSLDFLYEALKITTQCESGYKSSGHQRLHIEFALCSLCRLNGADRTGGETEEKKSSPVQITVPKEEPPAENQASNGQNHASQSVKPSVTSIKDLLKSAEQKIVKTDKARNREVGEDAINMEELISVWQKMAETENSLPNLANSIRQAKPELSGENTIQFFVANEVQKEWIERRCLLRLTDFLKINLNNKHIKLNVLVIPEEKIEKKLYMPDEKAKFLLESSEELRELQKDLKLEIK